MALPEDVVEEFLLRLPPADPASLVRAALVCKPWRRLVSSRRFRRRFREFHRTPPMLGFIHNTTEGFGTYVARFFRTASPGASSFRPSRSRADSRDCLALDARHGRVLLSTTDSGLSNLVVWDPLTDDSWQLPTLVLFTFGWTAAVLCAGAAAAGGGGGAGAGACDHLDCPRGNFLVVLLANAVDQVSLWVYSSEAGSWSEEAPVPQCYVDEMPTALVGNTLYFSIDSCRRILGYDLFTRGTSMIRLPPNSAEGATVLVTLEGGGLGAARQEGGTLSLWSMDTSSNVWAQTRVIELHKLLPLPVKALNSFTRIVFATGIGVFFVYGDGGLFTIDLKSDMVKKVLDNDENDAVSVVPYMSFYTPDFELLIGEGPRPGDSSTSQT